MATGLRLGVEHVALYITVSIARASCRKDEFKRETRGEERASLRSCMVTDAAE